MLGVRMSRIRLHWDQCRSMWWWYRYTVGAAESEGADLFQEEPLSDWIGLSEAEKVLGNESCSIVWLLEDTLYTLTVPEPFRGYTELPLGHDVSGTFLWVGDRGFLRRNVGVLDLTSIQRLRMLTSLHCRHQWKCCFNRGFQVTEMLGAQCSRACIFWDSWWPEIWDRQGTNHTRGLMYWVVLTI